MAPDDVYRSQLGDAALTKIGVARAARELGRDYFTDPVVEMCLAALGGALANFIADLAATGGSAESRKTLVAFLRGVVKAATKR